MGKSKSKFHGLIDKKYPSIGRYLRRMTAVIPDKKFISLQYKRHMGVEIDWENPETFNEKLQWLKVNWYDPDATICADKYEVRNFVREKIGEKYLTKLYGVYEDVDQINFNDLPEKFVLKGTHGSAMNLVCGDKKKISWEEEKKIIRNWLKTNFYYGAREWVYKDITPRIIIEEFLGENIVDYKLYCFNGEPKYWFVCSDRSSGVRADYYELKWEKAPFRWIYPPITTNPKKPENADEMVELARKLSKQFPFVRVDFYEIDGKVYFGELTFFHGGGFGWYEPREYNKILGNMLQLPK
jgi:hypothetical protein